MLLMLQRARGVIFYDTAALLVGTQYHTVNRPGSTQGKPQAWRISEQIFPQNQAGGGGLRVENRGLGKISRNISNTNASVGLCTRPLSRKSAVKLSPGCVILTVESSRGRGAADSKNF